MCTVLLRFRPRDSWPVLLAAVRDEFADREWDPPGRHWNGAAAGLVGGRDRSAGGTWLAVDPGAPAVAALLNGVRRGDPPDGVRPSRGSLPLTALTGDPLPDPYPFDGFHLLHAGPDRVRVWTWDGATLRRDELEPGDHILVNAGVYGARPDPQTPALPDHPLVTHFAPLLAALPDPDPRPGLAPEQAWGGWLRLLAGDGLDPTDPRALVIRRTVQQRRYASTSASLLALRPGAVRYDFTAPPGPQARWREVG
jgi:hypothetical protein